MHAYVRKRLRDKYGDSVVSAKGPIPAHLLGKLINLTVLQIFNKNTVMIIDIGVTLI